MQAVPGTFYDNENRLKCCFCLWVVEKCKCGGPPNMGIINGHTVSNSAVYFTQWLKTATNGNVEFAQVVGIEDINIRFCCKVCSSKLSVNVFDEYHIPADVQEYAKFHRHQPEPEKKVVEFPTQTSGTITLKPGDVIQFVGSDGLKTLTVGESSSTTVVTQGIDNTPAFEIKNPPNYKLLPLKVSEKMRPKKLETPKTGRRFR